MYDMMLTRNEFCFKLIKPDKKKMRRRTTKLTTSLRVLHAGINPQTGQLDYSAAWAEYYRQQGMHYHAQAILQQAGQGGGGQPSGQPPQPPQ